MLLKKAQERVPQPPPQPHCLETTYRTTFTEKDMSGIEYAVLSHLCMYAVDSDLSPNSLKLLGSFAEALAFSLTV